MTQKPLKVESLEINKERKGTKNAYYEDMKDK